jgi:hypothetical protein
MKLILRYGIKENRFIDWQLCKEGEAQHLS